MTFCLCSNVTWCMSLLSPHLPLSLCYPPPCCLCHACFPLVPLSRRLCWRSFVFIPRGYSSSNCTAASLPVAVCSAPSPLCHAPLSVLINWPWAEPGQPCHNCRHKTISFSFCFVLCVLLFFFWEKSRTKFRVEKELVNLCVDALVVGNSSAMPPRRGATYKLHRQPQQQRLVRHLMYTILQLLQQSQRPLRDTEIISLLAIRFNRFDPDFQRQVRLNLRDAVSYGILKRQSDVFTLRSKRFTEIVNNLRRPQNVWAASAASCTIHIDVSIMHSI